MPEPPSHFKTLAAVSGIVVGLILLKVITAALGFGRSSTPGAERGDFVLTEDDLPATIAEWNRTDFRPAKASDELSHGQYWWTHSWIYKSDSTSAIVSFDQADWVDWHDLTACYRMSGWEMKTRSIKSDGEWDYVVANYVRGELNATLVYSMFYDDGAPVPPAAFESIEGGDGLLGDLRRRNRNSNVRFSGRAFQCQVFAVADKRTEIALTELHLNTRKKLRDATAFQQIRTDQID